MIELRPMVASDLTRVERWLGEPHVARWWLEGTTARAELDLIRACVLGSEASPTRLLIVLEPRPREPAGAAAVGWCQWYPYEAYPAEAQAIGASIGDCGVDYALGDPSAVGRGLGTELIAALVAEVRRHHPGCGVIVDPDAGNIASRRVLEHTGFTQIAEHPVATEPGERTMAIYRLAPDREPSTRR